MNLTFLVVLLVLQIAGYVLCFWKNVKWMWLCQLGLHVLCFANPVIAHLYLSQAPVSGFEALAALGEVLRWLTALAMFGFTLLVTSITILIKWKNMDNKPRKTDDQLPEGRWW